MSRASYLLSDIKGLALDREGIGQGGDPKGGDPGSLGRTLPHLPVSNKRVGAHSAHSTPCEAIFRGVHRAWNICGAGGPGKGLEISCTKNCILSIHPRCRAPLRCPDKPQACRSASPLPEAVRRSSQGVAHSRRPRTRRVWTAT